MIIKMLVKNLVPLSKIFPSFHELESPLFSTSHQNLRSLRVLVRERGREGEREGEREGRREGGREGGREGEREGGREGEREGEGGGGGGESQ